MNRPFRHLRQSAQEREAANDAAYERGWVDSLRAYDQQSRQPIEDAYWYRKGWDACADYRWKDPKNRGSAPDLNFRVPRKGPAS